MKISAWDLFNVLKDMSPTQLKNTEVIIEKDRPYRNVFGQCEYATFIDEMTGQIRIGNVRDNS